MNKKLLSLLVVAMLSITTTSHALTAKSNLRNSTQSTPTLAILDTALDNTIPAIKNKLIYEVCILEWNTCPNGTSFMEGPNSALLPANAITRNGFDHGTQMASAAIAENANMNIVFVRIIGQNINFDRQYTSEKTISMALDWILQNRTKFNIQAVSMSQGHHNLLSGTDYCPKTPITENKIKELLNADVPVFLASGNSRDYTKIDWPSCIPASIAVGGATKNGIELYSNYDKSLLDFHANSRAVVTLPGGKTSNASGTSISAQIAAADWLAVKYAKPTLTYSQIYDLLLRTSRSVSGQQGPGKLIQLGSALNG